MKRGIVLLVVSLIFVSLGGDLFAAESKPSIPADVKFEQNVAYLEGNRDEKADLYLPAHPAAGEKRPGVLIIHGGGWTGGDKGAAREINIGTNLVHHGYVAMSINYVLATKDKPTWPQNLHDCKTAVRWMRKNADRLGIDPEHIGVIGGSAGGHLSAMVTLTAPEDGLDPKGPYGEFSCHVQCGVDLYGPADLMTYHDMTMLGKTQAQDPQLYKGASPTSYVKKTDPPILILHGTADTTVDIKQSQILAEALKNAGANYELVVVEGAPHSFHLQPKQKDLRPVVLGFFDKYLKGQK